jgi:hypothetical protein
MYLKSYTEHTTQRMVLNKCSQSVMEKFLAGGMAPGYGGHRKFRNICTRSHTLLARRSPERAHTIIKGN